MSYAAIRFAWWPPRRRPPPPPPEPPRPPAPGPDPVQTQLARLRTELLAEMSIQAKIDQDERDKLIELVNNQATRIEDQDRLIARLQERDEERRRHADGLTQSLERQAKEIGELRAKLNEREKSLRAQGRRLGELETQVKEVPGLREQLLRAQVAARMHEADAKDLRRRLEASGLPVPPPPAVADPAFAAAVRTEPVAIEETDRGLE